MRFPSLDLLAIRTRAVLLRFPWTMAAGVLAAVATIQATTHAHAHDTWWARLAMVAALGLPFTISLTLFAEERRWSGGRSVALLAAGVAALALFFLVWPGPEKKYETIRYFQLSAGLHLLVATLPFVGRPETSAFWQYNRRLFLNILRSAVFSMVLYVGLAIALGALDQLFGVDVPGELYARLYVVIAFVVNTAIFLSDVPADLQSLAQDRSYPRVLKVFAQYILTPIVFIYHVLLLAYLLKITAGGEWPSGWIGWLVTAVAVAGLLSFLLVHPLREEPTEAWIRGYTRWFFIGLIPAAVALLVAFWKRVLPYGFTELRLLGVLLGLWLLAIAINYTLRQNAGIRRIPVTLAALLLITLYGPLSVTSVSVASQGRRLKQLVPQARSSRSAAGEASSALRFLLEHGAERQVAAAIPGTLPPIRWDSLADNRSARDSVARRILMVAGVSYQPEYASRESYFYLTAEGNTPLPLSQYDWMMQVNSRFPATQSAGADSVRVRFDTASGVARIEIGGDVLGFDLRQLPAVRSWGIGAPQRVSPDRLSIEAVGSRHRGRLWLDQLDGNRSGDSIRVAGWSGKLLVGRR